MTTALTAEEIHVNFNDERPTVSAKELHDALEVQTKFWMWFPRICNMGFVEGTDYVKVYEKYNTSQSGRIEADFQLSVDMAKHICMVQKSEKGMAYRKYFLEIEKAWNSPDKVMARALQIASRQIEELQDRCLLLTTQTQEQEKQIRIMQPKAEYLDNVLHSESLILTTQIAKDYGMSAVRFNTILKDFGVQYRSRDQWVLYAKYQNQGYTASRSYEIQKADGRFTVSYQTEWTQKGRRFLYLFLKDRGIIPVVERQLIEASEQRREDNRVTDST